MLDAVLPFLRCPLCRAGLAAAGAALRCPAGHAFDVARQGYVSFLAGRGSGLVGDDAAMVEARARFLEAGHFAAIPEAIASLVGGVPPGLVADVGAGTGWHLARVLDARPGDVGLAVDLSKHAARRAAKAHPRAAAIAADARAVLPVADACAGVVLNVFAPRNAPELRRVVRGDGVLVVVTPSPSHLSELRAALGLLEVEPEKQRRVEETLGERFSRGDSRSLVWRMALSREEVMALVGMGPSARHLSAVAVAARVAEMAETVLVTAAVSVVAWRPCP